MILNFPANPFFIWQIKSLDEESHVLFQLLLENMSDTPVVCHHSPWISGIIDQTQYVLLKVETKRGKMSMHEI